MEGPSCVRWRGGDSVGANAAPRRCPAGYWPSGRGWIPGSRAHSSRAWKPENPDRRRVRLWPGGASPAIQTRGFRSPRRETDRSDDPDAVAGLGLAQQPYLCCRDSTHGLLPESRLTLASIDWRLSHAVRATKALSSNLPHGSIAPADRRPFAAA